MMMPFDKYKGREIGSLPRGYLRWLAENADLFGEVQREVHAAVGLPVPQAKSETVEEMQDRIVRSVMRRFEERERSDRGGLAALAAPTPGTVGDHYA